MENIFTVEIFFSKLEKNQKYFKARSFMDLLDHGFFYFGIGKIQ